MDHIAKISFPLACALLWCSTYVLMWTWMCARDTRYIRSRIEGRGGELLEKVFASENPFENTAEVFQIICLLARLFLSRYASLDLDHSRVNSSTIGSIFSLHSVRGLVLDEVAPARSDWAIFASD